MIATRHVSTYGALLVPLLVLVGGAAAAAEQVDDRKAARADARPSPVVPVGLDDTLQPREAAVPAPPAPDVSDAASEVPRADSVRTLVERLEAIDQSRRGTVRIDVEPASPAGETAAAAVEARWSTGDFEAALEELRALESAGEVAGVGIDWGAIGSATLDWTMDSRVGGTREGAQDLRLDFHASSENLFSVIRWGSTTGTSAWTVNVSTDHGVTWNETYAFASSVGLITVAAAVVGDYVYVAYVAGNVPDEARLRRASAITGAIDGGFGYVVVVAGGGVNVEEVALAANPDDYDNRVYYFALMADETVQYFFDNASDGQTFTDGGFPPTAQAEFGLDATYIHNGTCDEFLAISYAANDGTIRVWRRTETTWTGSVVEADSGAYRRTSISGYGTTLLCAYEFPYDSGTGVRYSASYDCGDTWSTGDIAVPDGTFYFGYFEPEVSARGGYGTGIAFQSEAGEFDPAFYRFRYGYGPGPWTVRARFNDYDLYTGSDVEMMILPPLLFPPPVDASIWSLGALYLSLDGGVRVPYYDTTIDFAFHDPSIFVDNFEAGNLDAWSGVIP